MAKIDIPILQIKDLSISLPIKADREYAVRNVSLSVRRGEILCVVGESGSGKSVMTSAILNDVAAGLRVKSGQVLFNGYDILMLTQKELNKIRGAQISMIYQEPMSALNPAMRIGHQVNEVFMLHRPEISAKQRKKETIKLLEQMKLPTPERIYTSYPHQVSGGQCQRIVIAMALACKPDILIADEPTTALDVTTQAEILSLINDLKDVYDNATIFITHDFGIVADIADKVAVMCKGQIVEQGPKEEILLHPKQSYTKLLVDAMPLLETTRTPDQSREDAPAVAVTSLHKIYGVGSKQVHALKDANFILKKGETLGVVGESGSGKSTLAKTLIRLEDPTSGSVKINNADFLALSGPELDKARMNIQMIFQDPFGSLNPCQTVEYMVTRGLLLQGIKPSDVHKRAVTLLNQVGLGEQSLKRKPINFSGGQRQRIGIARALAAQPELIICDEPVSALDAAVQAQILNLLRELQSKFELTYLFISHDLGVVQHMCDQIAVMYMGKIVEYADRLSLFNSPLHPYTSALLSAIPSVDQKRRENTKRILIPGDPPDPINPPKGCRFANRCPVAKDICFQKEPKLQNTKDNHKVACHLVDETAVSPLKHLL